MYTEHFFMLIPSFSAVLIEAYFEQREGANINNS